MDVLGQDYRGGYIGKQRWNWQHLECLLWAERKRCVWTRHLWQLDRRYKGTVYPIALVLMMERTRNQKSWLKRDREIEYRVFGRLVTVLSQWLFDRYNQYDGFDRSNFPYHRDHLIIKCSGGMNVRADEWNVKLASPYDSMERRRLSRMLIMLSSSTSLTAEIILLLVLLVTCSGSNRA